MATFTVDPMQISQNEEGTAALVNQDGSTGWHPQYDCNPPRFTQRILVRLSSLESKVENAVQSLRRSVRHNELATNDLEMRVFRVEKDVQEIEKMAKEETSELSSHVTNIQNQFEDLHESLEAGEDQIKKVDGQCSDASVAITRVDSRCDSLSQSLSQAENKIERVSSHCDDLQDSVGDLKTSIKSGIQQLQSQMMRTFDQLFSKVENFEGHLRDVETSVATIREKL